MSEIIDIQPVMTALSGESVIFETVDCYNEQITSNATLFCDIKKEVNNPATGPLYIEGAEPGDISDGTGPNTSRRFEKVLKEFLLFRHVCFSVPKS
ncbi:Acetamidase/Formamidase family protein [Sporomusa ovata DSM 2662]|uniref:Acetamidase/formamidase n=1 Tax=Sporomusa ovata TaxID=2378 RepID=A0A0U1KWI8_9FIRM|nr:acetamidase/formamidase family protein [Sporomusa ovata]EQB28265.1 acetamidase/formamidase family protein [Sporomusa ovata DSM 2662]CQR71808.1 Acetamidase/formamidase [Sporomusa ovata]